MDEDFLRQRRNVLLISIIILILYHSDASFRSITVAGVELKLGESGPYVLLLFFAYFVIRFFNYFDNKRFRGYLLIDIFDRFSNESRKKKVKDDLPGSAKTELTFVSLSKIGLEKPFKISFFKGTWNNKKYRIIIHPEASTSENFIMKDNFINKYFIFYRKIIFSKHMLEYYMPIFIMLISGLTLLIQIFNLNIHIALYIMTCVFIFIFSCLYVIRVIHLPENQHLLIKHIKRLSNIIF